MLWIKIWRFYSSFGSCSSYYIGVTLGYNCRECSLWDATSAVVRKNDKNNVYIMSPDDLIHKGQNGNSYIAFMRSEPKFEYTVTVFPTC